MIYLDYAATAPTSKSALATYIDASQTYFANSSSLHSYGTKVTALLEYCRKKIGSLLHVNSDGIYFTSGGTEANILCVQSHLNTVSKEKKKILMSPLEHSSLHNAIAYFQKQGYEVEFIPLTNYGTVDLHKLEQQLNEKVAMLIIQHVNSETGIIQPMEDIGKLAKKFNVHWHADCVQSVGKYTLPLQEWGVSSISASSHKFYGPKGVGFAYMNPNLLWKSNIPNITHEKGFRAGTVPVPLIASMTTALAESIEQQEIREEHLFTLHKECRALLDPLTIVTPKEHYAPHILGILLPNMEGQWAMLECDRKGIGISTGSACLVGMNEPSHAVTALGITGPEAKSFIRASFGYETTLNDIRYFANTLKEIIAAIPVRNESKTPYKS